MVVVTHQKIKKRKLSQQESRIVDLQERLSYYLEITETIREPFIILDKNLCVVTANEAFYLKFKVKKNDTEKRLIYELGNNQWDSLELRELLESILPQHQVLNNYEVTYNFPGIGRKIMLLNARQIDAKQLILLAFEDVTEGKQFKTDSDAMTAGLIDQRDKLKTLSAAKDEFINMASHQLRTPATVVKQYIGMLAEGYGGKLTKKQKDMVNSAYTSNERELVIIEDLLRVARVDGGKVYLVKSSYDIVQQIEDVVNDQLAAIGGSKNNIIFNRPIKQVTVHLDPKLIRMILENLLDNAVKYSYEGQPITIGLKQNKTHTTITMKDGGVGISRENQYRLFKRFSRIPNPLSMAVNGTGLGLYWVKKIVELHKGNIEILSSLKRGSTFTVKLPILKPEAKIHAEHEPIYQR